VDAGSAETGLRAAAGFSGQWTIRAATAISLSLRRLTRVHTRSVEEPVNLDEGFQYNWPFLYGVEVGHWDLTENQAKLLREFLLRGGFFLCDDFHGSIEWPIFTQSMKRVFPDPRSWTWTTASRSFTRSTIWARRSRCPARRRGSAGT
jgi:hypothetical protein